MEQWKQALTKFINQYADKDYVEGVLLCGSYASGNQTADSDIDVHIITNNEQDWRERGNTEIDGFLIEYFTNPVRQMMNYFETNYQNNIATNINMFAYGIILSDKNGEMVKLQEAAKSYIGKEFKPISDTANQNTLYHLWDMFDELKVLYKSGQSTTFYYHYLLTNLIKAHYAYNRIPTVPFAKIERIFTDETFRQKYHITKMPSQKFIDLFLQCLKEQSLPAITQLYTYVVDDCGGFDIRQFVMRTPVQIDTPPETKK